MVLRRPLIILSLLLVALVTVVVVVSNPPQVELHPPASQPSLPVALGSGLLAPPPDLAVSTTYTGPAYDPAVVRSPTRDKPQSKLWFNDGLWWAVMYAQDSHEFHIWWLDRGSQRWVDTGTLVDERPYARQDADIVAGSLVIVSGGTNDGSAHHAIRLLRFTYDAAARTYRLDAGYPVQVAPAGGEAPTLAADPDGGLWVTFIADNRVHVAYGAANLPALTPPFILPGGPRAVVGAAQAAIVPRDDGVAVIWSNLAEDAVHYVAHRAGDDPATWQPAETALEGTLLADDHVSVASLVEEDGLHVFAAIKTGLDRAPDRSQQAPQIVLLERRPDGTWGRYQVGRVSEHHTRPVVGIDLVRHELLVFATSPFDGGQIYLKRSALDRIAFGDGIGQAVITGTPDPKINNATVAAQPFTAESGIVVLATDDVSGRYLFAEVGGTDASPPTPPAVVTAQDLARPTFDGLGPGADLLDLGWSAADDSATFVATTDPDGTTGALLRSGTGAGVRACTAFAPQVSGRLTASARVRIVGPTTRNAAMIAIRGGGKELTGIRFMAKGLVAWQDGATFVRGSAAWTAGAWYVVSATVDLASRQWSFAVHRDTANGPLVAQVADLAWQAAADAVDEACVQLPAAAAGTYLEVDALTVHRTINGG